MILTNKYLQVNHEKKENKEISISGWIRSNRDQKDFGFLVVNDGSTFDSIQCVYPSTLDNIEEIKSLRTGACVQVTGILIETPSNLQKYEIQVKSAKVLGDAELDYPIQPKRHTREFLRTQAHLRVRTNLYNAIFRVRSEISYCIHQFFHKNNFYYVHTPIITANDGEGAGQTFNITTLDVPSLVANKKEVDYKEDFFGKKTSLAVTGQLEAEAMALGLGKVYTFGPTFRAENSNTMTHASEFWMIEPEMAFTDLKGDMKVMEDLLKYVLKYAFANLKTELEFFDKFVENGLIERLTNDLNKKISILTHEEAIKILQDSKVDFEFKPVQGEDISREHEKYLTDVHCKTPLFLINWPKDIKAFYMKVNSDSKTVAAVDLLVSKAGELMGGSQRETSLPALEKRMKELDMSTQGLEWYLDLRKYGGCTHSGFGMGFERLLIYLTGVENIRDVQLFPRTPKNCEF